MSLRGHNEHLTPPEEFDPTEDAIEAIMVERNAQVKRWGNAFDDTHTQNDWVAFITCYAGKAMQKNPGDEGNQYPNPEAFKSAMVKVGALAVAALEAYHRWLGAQPPQD